MQFFRYKRSFGLARGGLVLLLGLWLTGCPDSGVVVEDVSIITIIPDLAPVGGAITILGENFTQGSPVQQERENISVAFQTASGEWVSATPTEATDYAIKVLVPSGAVSGDVLVRKSLGDQVFESVNAWHLEVISVRDETITEITSPRQIAFYANIPAMLLADKYNHLFRVDLGNLAVTAQPALETKIEVKPFPSGLAIYQDQQVIISDYDENGIYLAQLGVSGDITAESIQKITPGCAIQPANGAGPSAIGINAGQAYVVNTRGQCLSRLDLSATNPAAEPIEQLGKYSTSLAMTGERYIASSAGNDSLYLGEFNQNTLSRYPFPKEEYNIDYPLLPMKIVLDPTSDYGYVLMQGDLSVHRLNLASSTPELKDIIRFSGVTLPDSWGYASDSYLCDSDALSLSCVDMDVTPDGRFGCWVAQQLPFVECFNLQTMSASSGPVTESYQPGDIQFRIPLSEGSSPALIRFAPSIDPIFAYIIDIRHNTIKRLEMGRTNP